MYIGKNIKYLRKNRGMTQDELGNHFGFGYTTVGKWERGESKPDADTLIELSSLFSVSLDDLVKVDLSARPQVPGSGTNSKVGGSSPEMDDIMRRLSLLEQSQDVPPDKVRELLRMKNDLIRQFPEVAKQLGLDKN